MRKSKLHCFLFLFGSFSLANSAHAALSDFLSAAENISLEALAEQAEVNAQSSQRNAIYLGLLPSVYLEGRFAKNDPESKLILGPESEKIIVPKEQQDYSITAKLPVIDFAKWTNSSIESAALEAAKASQKESVASLKKRIGASFHSMIAARSVLKSVEKAGQTSAKNLKFIEERKISNLASELDVARAKADLAKQNQLLSEAQNSLKKSVRNLETLTNLNVKLEAEDETLPEPASLQGPQSGSQSAMQSAMQQFSVENDPMVLAALAYAETAQARSTAAKSAYIPLVSLNAQRKWASHPGIGGQEQTDSIWLLASWKFEFGVFSADASLQSLAQAARLRADLAKKQAMAQFEELKDRVSFSLSSIQAAEALIQANQIAVNLTQKRFESGLSSLLELQEAQRDLLSAEVGRIQALADYHQAELELSLQNLSESKLSKH